MDALWLIKVREWLLALARLPKRTTQAAREAFYGAYQAFAASWDETIQGGAQTSVDVGNIVGEFMRTVTDQYPELGRRVIKTDRAVKILLQLVEQGLIESLPSLESLSVARQFAREWVYLCGDAVARLVDDSLGQSKPRISLHVRETKKRIRKRTLGSPSGVSRSGI